MSASAFQFTSLTPITAQPNTAGEKLIFRSDNAADTGNYTQTGLVASVSTAETNALLGKREVQTAAMFTSFSSGLLSAAQTGTVRVYGQGTKAAGDVRVDSLPANNDNLKVGLTGFEQTYLFKTTLTGSANEIKIAASVGAQATNIYEAVNAGSNAGTDYGTGTAANAYGTATAPVGAVVALTDRIAVSRQLAWNVSQTVGATLSIRPLIGGATGTLLATFSPGDTHVYNSFSLASEDLSAPTLPALFTGTSDWIAVRNLCTLRFKCANVGTAITAKYQTSTDGSNPSDPLTTGISLDDLSVLDPLYVIPEEQNIEYIRLVITANPNTTDSALDARAIY